MEILTLLFAIVLFAVVISPALRHTERICVTIPMKHTRITHDRRQYN